MTLAEFVARARRQILEELEADRDPGIGSYSSTELAEARLQGRPQLGTVAFFPDSILLEFIFGSGLESKLFTVALEPQERIVYLPVPNWVVENIWQGTVDGTYHFESHAKALLDGLIDQMTPINNKALFGKQPPKRRE